MLVHIVDMFDPDVLVLPDRLTTSTPWHGHIPFAFWLTKNLAPRMIVELGVHKGDSFAAFCQAVDMFRLPTLCYGIDTWKGDAHAGYYDEEVFSDITHYVGKKYSTFAYLIRDTFDSSLKYFSDGSVDLLHIDGFHTYEAVRHDFETWLNKLSSRAVVVLHDICVRERGFGVWRFWEEIKCRYPNFEFLHSHGLGVLGIGQDVPSEVRSLFELDSAATARIQAFFGILGTRINVIRDMGKIQEESNELVKEVGVRELEIANLRTQIDNRDEEIRKLIGEIQQAKVQIESKQHLSEASQQIANELRNEVRRLSTEVRKLARELGDRDRELRLKVEEKDEVIRRLAHVEEQLFRYKSLVEEYHNSFSWRVTRPIRFVGRILRGRRPHFRESPPWTGIDTSSTLKGGGGSPQKGAPPLLRSFRVFRVLYISGMPEGNASFRYRVTNFIKALEIRGIEAKYIFDNEIRSHVSEIALYDVIVLFRVAWNSDVEFAINEARNNGSIIIFDVDDYVFEPSIVRSEIIDGLRFLTPGERSAYDDGVRRYRQSLMAADFATGTTHFLVGRYEELGKTGFVLKNSLDPEKVELSARILSEREKSRDHSDTVVIGYASGTRTHQKDFTFALPSLVEVMDTYPHVSLVIIGELDLGEFPQLKPYKGRIKQYPLLPYDQLLRVISEFNINIAPLEIGNPFCEAKSELKYFDAAIVEVPTVASATSSFASCIENGVNGFLARSREDWTNYLSLLVTNHQAAVDIGKRARHHVLSVYTPEVQGGDIEQVYRNCIRLARRRQGIGDDTLSVSVLVPPVSKGSGGHSKIFSIVNGLSKKGHHCNIYVEGPSQDHQTLESIASSYNLNTDKIRLYFGFDSIGCADCFIATFWKTAYVADKFKRRASAVFYFIQDYEPYFYPMGTDYIMAQATYTLGLHGISYGPWCKATVKALHGVEVDSISFYIDKQMYYERPGRRKDNVIAFFVRPEMPRRCFDLGIMALSEIHRQMGCSIEIVLFGARLPDGFSTDFPFKNAGVLSRSELAELFSEATLGIAFSTTNPSMIPFEMMACGLPVVDLDYGFNSVAYGGKENALLVPPDPHLIAQAIKSALQCPEELRRLSENGRRMIEGWPEEAEVIAQFEKILQDQMAR